MVGHRGIEPRDTCVSGRPRRPAGSWPADGGGPDPQRSRALPGSSRSRPPSRFAIRERRAEVLSPTASRRPPVFETEPAAWQVHSPWRKTVDTIHRAFTPTRFPAGDHRLVVSSPSEESGRLERHGATRASVSNGARHPGRFTLHERRPGTGAPRGTDRPARSCFPASLRAPPEIRTRNLFLLREAPLPSWARRAFESDRPDSNRC